MRVINIQRSVEVDEKKLARTPTAIVSASTLLRASSGTGNKIFAVDISPAGNKNADIQSFKIEETKIMRRDQPRKQRYTHTAGRKISVATKESVIGPSFKHDVDHVSVVKESVLDVLSRNQTGG